jgi:predicted transcriptional regulator
VATSNLITLDGLSTIRDAARVLSSNEIEGAPVMDDEEVIGMVTLSDISKALAESREEMKVLDIMSKHIVTIKEDGEDRSCQLNHEQKTHRRLIVLDKEGKARECHPKQIITTKLPASNKDQQNYADRDLPTTNIKSIKKLIFKNKSAHKLIKPISFK